MEVNLVRRNSSVIIQGLPVLQSELNRIESSTEEGRSGVSPKTFSGSMDFSPIEQRCYMGTQVPQTKTPPISSSSVISSPGPICRICHSGNENEKFISPCQCSGSVKFVHKTCLQRWLTSSQEERCELCSFVFCITKVQRPFSKFLQESDEPNVRKAILSDILCLIILTPLLVGTIYCVFVTAEKFQLEEKANNTGQRFLHNYLQEQRNRDIIVQVNRTVHSTVVKAGPISTPLIWQSAQFPRVIALVVGLLFVYSLWLVIALRYHWKRWMKWSSTHYDVLVLEGENFAEKIN